MVATKSQRRKMYFDKLTSMVEKYKTVLLVSCDHVGSLQMAHIRQSLRGKATILMGKNTMTRSCLRRLISRLPQLQQLLDQIKLNIGLVFCDIPANDVREILLQHRVPAQARQGVIAPIDVKVPAGGTGLDPTQTSFFQALSIGTKIVKGQIEIQSEVHLIKMGEKVTASQSTLLQKLNIQPFMYGLVPLNVYDNGSVYDSAVLDISDDDVKRKFGVGVTNVAALCRAINFPTSVSIGHSIAEGLKFCAALCIESGSFTFPEIEGMRKFVDDPTAFQTTATAIVEEPQQVKEEETKEESEDSEDDDMGFSLFD